MSTGRKLLVQTKTLESFCRSESSLQTRIALLTFYNRNYSDWTEIFILILEYFQLISQSLIYYASSSGDTTSSDSSLVNAVCYFFKLVNPSCLMSINENNSLSATILLIVFCSMILKYLLFLYVVIVAYGGYQGNNLLLALWRWIFTSQTRILCFLTTSFWATVIMGCSEGSFQIEGMNSSGIIGICCVLMLIEYQFSFYIEIHFDYVLPTRNFLAAKSCMTQVLTLLQKLVLQIVYISAQSNFKAGTWMFSTLNIFFTAIKIHQCYDKLLLYQIKALLSQNILHSLVLSLNLACFAQTLLIALNFNRADINFIIIIWFVSAILIIKALHEIFSQRIANILKMGFVKCSPELLLHKVVAVRELRKHLKLPGEDNEKFDFAYLLNVSENVHRKNIFGLDAAVLSELSDIEGVFVQYLTDLSIKFPTNSLVKLHLAHACLRDTNLYIKSIKTTAEIAQKRWSQSYLSASLLIIEAEKTIVSLYRNSEGSLDLFAYMNSKKFELELQEKVLKQADLNIKICNNILNDTANIGCIFNYAQEANRCKQQLHKKINLIHDNIPDSSIAPFLLVAGYHLILGYSEDNFQKYIDIYTQKKIKNRKYFKSMTLTKENLYQTENILLMLSGEKTSNGQIVFCSESIQNVCGGKTEAYRGTHISTLFTPSFQSYYYDEFKRIIMGETKLMNKIQRAFILHKESYILEVEFYFKIHPYLTHGLYLSMIIRATHSFKEYLLVKEDGSIEGATKTISDTLGLHKAGRSPSSFHNIKVLSEELWEVNQAFNIVAKAQNQDKTEQDKILMSREYQRAHKVYTVYASGTTKIGLLSLDHSKETRLRNERGYYDCNISLLPCGSTFVKVIELVKLNERGMRLDDLNSSDRSSPRVNTLKDQNDEGVEQSENIECEERIHSDEMITQWRAQTDLNTWTALSSPTNHRLLSNRSENKNFKKEGIVKQIGLSHRAYQADMVKKVLQVEGRYEVPVVQDDAEFMSTSQIANMSNSKTANTAFRSAIAINFRPKSFRAICIMFYGVIFMTFFSQLVLKIISDNTIETLTVTKNLLSLSQLRTYRMLFIVINCRRAVNNIIDPNLNNGQTFTGMAAIVDQLKPHEILMESYNQQTLANLYSLESDIKQFLFAKDIRVYGSYTNSDTRTYYKDVTIFEVVAEVADAIQKLGPLKQYPQRLSGNEGYNLWNFILLNIINDYLYKSQEITDMFVHSVNKERDYFQATITLCLIVTPLILIGIVVMLIVIIWKQYNMEKKHMLAFIRLKPKSVKDILNRLVTFKKYLANRDLTTFQEWLESIKDLDVTTQNEQQEISYHKKHDAQVIKYSETRIRYFGYVLKVAFYILILIGIMLWNFVSAQNSTRVIFKKQSQLQFAYHLSEIASIIYCANGEMFGSNNTNQVRHKLAKTTIIEGLEELKSMQNQLQEMFLQDTAAYNPVVEAMIFRYNTCEPYNFNTPSSITYCNFLTTHGGNTNLLSLMATARAAETTKLLDYENCNKSTIHSILTCAYTNIDYLLPSYALAAIEAQKIGDIIADDLELNIANAYTQRNVFLAAFSVSLAIVSLLIWLQVLRKVRDIHNDFKKVLQIFPPKMILSSFLLKNFLIKNKNF